MKKKKKRIIEPGYRKHWTKDGPGIHISDEGDIWIDLSEGGEIVFTRSEWEKKRREIVEAPKEGNNVSNTGNRGSS